MTTIALAASDERRATSSTGASDTPCELPSPSEGSDFVVAALPAALVGSRAYGIVSRPTVSDSTSHAMAHLAALTSTASYRVLARLADTGAVSFAELEEELSGWSDWAGVARLFRAGYVAEGARHLHLTHSGRDALAMLRALRPSLPR